MFEQENAGDAILRFGEGWRIYRSPLSIRSSHDPEEVADILDWAASESSSRPVVLALSFDAASSFEPAAPRVTGEGPLIWAAVYEAYEKREFLPPPALVPFWIELGDPLDPNLYHATFDRILEHIREGRTYQLNFTFDFMGQVHGNPLDLFLSIVEVQPPPYAAFINLGSSHLLCFSPELFFAQQGDRVWAKPMKGTRPADHESGEEMRLNPKDRAENLMIVDMIRNDLGRIAVPGSVQVAPLFEIEEHRTVFQMTSTVSASLNAKGPAEVIRALFPCASVVGAPKVEALKVIHELEDRPRGFYCGSIGCIDPDKTTQFNVAIRTLTIDESRRARYGVGSGIVADSLMESEYDECKIKRNILDVSSEDWGLLETLRWSPEEGFDFLVQHLARLEKSSIELGFLYDSAVIVTSLRTAVEKKGVPQRVRLVLRRDGKVQVESVALGEWQSPLKAAVAVEPVDEGSRWLLHKTTRRGLYDWHRSQFPLAEEVLLWNRRGEICEWLTGNVVVEVDGRRVTPPLDCGVLPGVLRKVLIERGEIQEQVIPLSHMQRAEKIWHVNSVRGWTPVQMSSPEEFTSSV